MFWLILSSTTRRLDAEQFEIRIEHDLHQLVEAHFRRPPYSCSSVRRSFARMVTKQV
jgi:hypothetical protein